MIRSLHRWPGLIAAALLVVLSLSGATLSVFPALETVRTPAQTEAGLSVAKLAARIQAAYPGVEQIRRAPSGRITAYWFDGGMPGAAVIDPATGLGVGSADMPAAERWLKTLHRSLFLDDAGRIAAAAAAAAMLVLSLTGMVLVVRRTGGWRQVLAPLKGSLSGRLHVEIARLSIVGLLLSSTTALWMSASTFGYAAGGRRSAALPGGERRKRVFPGRHAGAARHDGRESARADLSLSGRPHRCLHAEDRCRRRLISIRAPAYFWPGATFGAWDRVTETIYMLHTGQGAALLGLVLGLMALGVPVMAGTGSLIWVAGRRGRPRLRGNARAAQADTILLVGSEGGSTWGFAATLHAALTAAEQKVHAAPMSAFAPARYTTRRPNRGAGRDLWRRRGAGLGQGLSRPAGRLAGSRPTVPLAVLGFGDRSFPPSAALRGRSRKRPRRRAGRRSCRWTAWIASRRRISPAGAVRSARQSGYRWSSITSPSAPRTEALTLISRRDYGAEVQAPTAILRFALAAGNALAPADRVRRCPFHGR